MRPTFHEVAKRFNRLFKRFDEENIEAITLVFYDFIKIAYYHLQKKLQKNPQNTHPLILKDTDVTKLLKIIHYFHTHNETHKADTYELKQCFGNFTEDDAKKFFLGCVLGDTKDLFGREIHISKDSIQFMYKDENEKHNIKSESYKSIRGKRLPWIRHTIKNSTNIYTRIDKKSYREIMYINKYKIEVPDKQWREGYWVVIVKKRKKDKMSPYQFKTAFSVTKYNSLLSRLAKYLPVTEVSNV